MQALPTLTLDLPLKALVWQDEANVTWLAYNDPAWLAARHCTASQSKATLDRMSDVLAAVTRQAADPVP